MVPPYPPPYPLPLPAWLSRYASACATHSHYQRGYHATPPHMLLTPTTSVAITLRLRICYQRGYHATPRHTGRASLKVGERVGLGDGGESG
eukprot:2846282-Rhodomonas_salina.2